MAWINFLLLPAFLWVALEPAIAPGVLATTKAQSQGSPSDESHHHWQISDSLPPLPKNPIRTTGGGRRNGGSCPQDAKTSMQSLIALSPVTELGLTLAERPTFLVSVPPTSAQTAEFSLFDQSNQGIYQTTFALTNTHNIVRFTLPPTAPPLAVGKEYTWFFALICDPKIRRRDQVVTGRIERIQLAAAQVRQIEQAVPKERISLYRKAGIWYEALSTLVELQRQSNDPTLRVTWRELLRAGGLDATTLESLRK